MSQIAASKTELNGYVVENSDQDLCIGRIHPKKVWELIWGLCTDKGCDGTTHIDGPKHFGESNSKVYVKVTGDYREIASWDTRQAMMEALLAHHYGHGGVCDWSGMWWIAENTWIRGSHLWVNIEIFYEGWVAAGGARETQLDYRSQIR
jgi:hypothetical protein